MSRYPQLRVHRYAAGRSTRGAGDLMVAAEVVRWGSRSSEARARRPGATRRQAPRCAVPLAARCAGRRGRPAACASSMTATSTSSAAVIVPGVASLSAAGSAAGSRRDMEVSNVQLGDQARRGRLGLSPLRLRNVQQQLRLLHPLVPQAPQAPASLLSSSSSSASGRRRRATRRSRTPCIGVRGFELEPGFARLGTASFGVLARSRRLFPLALRALGLQYRIEPIHLKRGRRAWNALAAGLLVSRGAYGEDLNRYYFRGLPRAETESWEMIRIRPYAAYSRRSSPRAWTSGNLVLVPPEVWRLGRSERRSLMRQAASASSPEGVARVMRIVRDVAVARSLSPLTPASSQPPVDRDRLLHAYRHVARVADVASVSSPAVPSDLPSSERGGYASSVHSSQPDGATGDPAPGAIRGLSHAETARASPAPSSPDSEQAWKQRRIERERRLLAETLERLRKLFVGGKDEGKA